MKIYKKKTVRQNKNKNVTIIRESAKNLSSTNMANNYVPDDDILIVVDNEDGTYQLKMGDGKNLCKNLTNIANEGGGGGGTSDYDQLSNRPSINGKVLSGTIKLADIGAAAASDITAEKAAREQAVQDLQTTVNNKLDSTSMDNYYTKTEADSNLTNALSGKADKADYYTKDIVDKKLDEKVIPTAVSELTNDSNYQTGTNVLQTIAEKVPTNLSGFTNDSNYQDKEQLDKAISEAIAGVSQFDYQKVATLPTTGVKGTIYILEDTDADGATTYEQYLWVDKWIPMSAKVDLSGYVKTIDVKQMIEVAGSHHADTTKANEFTNVNDFKALTVHTAEYTPSQVALLTGIDQYLFPRKCAVGETIDTTLPCANIQTIEIADTTIFSYDMSGATATLTGLKEGSTTIGLRTITGYLMQMNFYCLASHSATGKTYAKVQIDGITNGSVLKAGETYKISSIMYADTDEGRAALPTGDVADIYVNNSSSGIDGCNIAYAGANWGSQTYTINGVEYTNMSRCYFNLSNLKPGIYTLGGFYLGMDRSETNPVETVDECLNTTTLTFAVTKSGKATEFDKLDVEEKLVSHDTLVTRAKSDYYIATTFEMTGKDTYGSTSNVMLATGKGDKKTYFNLVAADISLITVNDESKEYVTFDFSDKSFTYIKSTSDNTPLPVTVSYNGAVVGTAYVNFTTSKAVQPTNINVTIGIVPRYTDAGINTMIDTKIDAKDLIVQGQLTTMQADINSKASSDDITKAIKDQVINNSNIYSMSQLFNGGFEATNATIHMLTSSATSFTGELKYSDDDGDYNVLTEKDLTTRITTVDSIYPVGSVYLSMDANFNPNVTWVGTTWEKLADGIFLESNAVPGTETEAGLPNITGNSYNIQGVGYSVDGAFTKTALGNASWSGNIGGYHHLHFDASRSSAVYGKSTTVQPHSITVVMWKRTA